MKEKTLSVQSKNKKIHAQTKITRQIFKTISSSQMPIFISDIHASSAQILRSG